MKKNDALNINKNDRQFLFSSSLPSASNLFVLNTDGLSTAKMIPHAKSNSLNVKKNFR